NASGEFREIVRLMQPFQGLLPQAAVDEVIPLRDQVVDGATTGHAAEQGPGVTERDAAVHATGGLVLELLGVHVFMELVPVTDAFVGFAVRRQFPEVFNESSRFSHGLSCVSGQKQSLKRRVLEELGRINRLRCAPRLSRWPRRQPWWLPLRLILVPSPS